MVLAAITRIMSFFSVFSLKSDIQYECFEPITLRLPRLRVIDPAGQYPIALVRWGLVPR